MEKISSYWYLLIGILSIQCFVILWYRIELVSDKKRRVEKYVGLHLNYGRLGNQLFHLVTGYGIARTLGRIHYLPFEEPRSHVSNYLKIFDETFPELRRTYVLSSNETNQTVIAFAGSCCAYDNPRRLLNESAQYLLLDFVYGQNPHYFDGYLPEIRSFLRFSDEIRREGNDVVKKLQLNKADMLCIHIRMTDFTQLGISTNPNDTVQAANSIARKQGISRFMIFGDDQNFMDGLSKMIAMNANPKAKAVIVSNFTEVTDLYLASQVCQSFLITAATSTFGWWLAFFIQDQNAVFYMPDDRIHGDKVPSKDLFLTSWQQHHD